MSSQLFYKNLTKSKISLVELLSNTSLFQDVPTDWHVVVADIENSTQAVRDGLHQDVNLTATGSIIAVLNKLKETDPSLRVPYFFGGDGATFIVPSVVVQVVLSVLENYRLRIERLTELNLKVGSYSVSDIYYNNNRLRIAKVKLTPNLTVPVVLGAGLKFAEQHIKSTFEEASSRQTRNQNVDLNGMQCRWQKVDAPTDTKKILCLLAYAKQEDQQAPLYYSIIKKIDTLFGDFEARQPISTPKLLLDISLQRVKKEMLYNKGEMNWMYLTKNWFYTILGKYYFKYFKDGKKYLKNITELSDTLMIDGSINTIISGTQSNINEFISFLDEMEQEEKIHYGIHVTHASIMSCYVEDLKTNHHHFIDGTEGGYTAAAIMLKQKIKTSK